MLTIKPLNLKFMPLLAICAVIGLNVPLAYAQNAAPASASPSAETNPENAGAAENLTWAMASLLFVNYNCQVPLGNEVYAQTRDLIGDMAASLADNEAMGKEFVTAAEDIAKAGCPDPNTCWRTYLELDANATLADAAPKCQEQMSNTVLVVQDLIDTLTAEE
jgi:hypothetical protein